MREVRASAPGKVNLLLKVGRPTEDGYHPLVTIFECLNVREYVTVRTSRSPGIRVETRAYAPDGSCDEATTAALAELPAENHLAVRAAKALQPLAAMGPWKATAAGLTITVEKHIPVAGGMAGGSADAAATLVACNELWELGLSRDQLEAVGRNLGADVPACIRGGVTLGEGRGDHLTSLPEPTRPRHWVMATAFEGLSTPEVFRTYDALQDNAGWDPLPEADEALLAPFSAGTGDVAGAVGNDLTAPAVHLRPELATTLEAGREAGALAAILSGSGPTCAFLAADADHAGELATVLAILPSVKSVCVTSGSAAPARIEDTAAF